MLGSMTRAAALLFSTLCLSAPAYAEAPPRLPEGPVGGRDPLVERFADLRSSLSKDRRTPRAFIDLARLHELEGDLPELAHLAGLYAAVAEDHRESGEVRALA